MDARQRGGTRGGGGRRRRRDGRSPSRPGKGPQGRQPVAQVRRLCRDDARPRANRAGGRSLSVNRRAESKESRVEREADDRRPPTVDGQSATRPSTLNPQLSTLNTVAILGTGLIGGSLGLALRERKAAGTVVGWNRGQDALTIA